MAITIEQLFAPTVLGTVEVVIYTASSSPPSTVMKNGRARLTNTGANTVTVTLNVAPGADISSAANSCLFDYSITAGDYLDIAIPVMRAGDTFRGTASEDDAITVHQLDGTIFS